MGIWDSFNKDNFTNGLKIATETADKAVKHGSAGGKFISEKTLKGATVIKENVQNDLARRQETKIIQIACEEILAKNRLQLTVSQNILEEEITIFNESIEQISKKQLYVYSRYCKYRQEYRQQKNITKSSLADAVYPDSMNLWQSKKYATGAMAAGAATGIAAIGLVTALGLASTGTALYG